MQVQAAMLPMMNQPMRTQGGPTEASARSSAGSERAPGSAVSKAEILSKYPLHDLSMEQCFQLELELMQAGYLQASDGGGLAPVVRMVNYHFTQDRRYLEHIDLPKETRESMESQESHGLFEVAGKMRRCLSVLEDAGSMTRIVRAEQGPASSLNAVDQEGARELDAVLQRALLRFRSSR